MESFNNSQTFHAAIRIAPFGGLENRIDVGSTLLVGIPFGVALALLLLLPAASVESAAVPFGRFDFGVTESLVSLSEISASAALRFTLGGMSGLE